VNLRGKKDAEILPKSIPNILFWMAFMVSVLLDGEKQLRICLPGGQVE